MPQFQTNGAFDPTRYEAFVQNFTQNFSPRGGFTEEQIFEIIRDSIRVDRIKALLGTTAPTAPSEVCAVLTSCVIRRPKSPSGARETRISSPRRSSPRTT